MTIFISHSVKDSPLVERIAAHLRLQGHTVHWWFESAQPGEEVWAQIRRWIDQADLVLVIITEAAVRRAMAIGNEVGHAKAKNKRLIPLVASDVPESELGCLQGIAHIRFDPKDPQQAVTQLLHHTTPALAPVSTPQPAMSPAAGWLVAGVLLLLLAALVSEK